jgi:hypothetical protein
MANTALVRRRVFDQVSFDPRFRVNAWREETSFFISAVEAGFRVLLTDETHALHLQRHAGGQRKSRLVYEYWVIRNNWRFLGRHQMWLKRNDHMRSRLCSQLYFIGRRIARVVYGRLSAPSRHLGRLVRAVRHVATGSRSKGFCPVCQGRTLFLQIGPSVRESLVCIRCRSSSRARALVYVLDQVRPDWKTFDIYESGPAGSASRMMMDECADYIYSQYLPHMPPGSEEDGIRSENLEELTFVDHSFDLVVTQDVLEHIVHPTKAFREIERVLRSGGRHVFTVPYDATRGTSVTRALVGADGTLQLVLPPEYHYDALSPKGVLVVTDWGVDLVQQIDQVSAMVTTIHPVRDRHIGVDPIINVFVSHKKRDDSNLLGQSTPKNDKLR